MAPNNSVILNISTRTSESLTSGTNTLSRAPWIARRELRETTLFARHFACTTKWNPDLVTSVCRIGVSREYKRTTSNRPRTTDRMTIYRRHTVALCNCMNQPPYFSYQCSLNWGNAEDAVCLQCVTHLIIEIQTPNKSPLLLGPEISPRVEKNNTFGPPYPSHAWCFMVSLLHIRSVQKKLYKCRMV